MSQQIFQSVDTVSDHKSLELWGGIECTINRVGDVWFDQMRSSGHDCRLDDLDLIAELGIRMLRYPVLWEKVAPNSPDERDWKWTDERLGRLRQLGICPIAGLVHHGSGPHYTNLLDPEFPQKLAAYARAVAERYPHLEYFTPVNEPLTTARFSGLYGHWYPHHTSDESFLRTLIHQCAGVALAMKEIRQVIPEARLVQTEDMGRTYSTPRLAYQANFENERRWLSYDLLCGRVDSNHRLWKYFMKSGIHEDELAVFQEETCPPDIMGINYYLTSERFLDEKLDEYPKESHGGNGRHKYADVEAVRVSNAGIAGAGAMLREAWERYGLPLAITEAHLACTREEQIRWLWEVWNQAAEVRKEGVDVRAVTAWSLLGAYNWNTLVTRDEGYYEPGVFDLRSIEAEVETPRPTALAHLVGDLAQRRSIEHPVLETPGWWRQPDRLLHTPNWPHQPHPQATSPIITSRPQRPKVEVPVDPRPLLITGATGTLGKAFARLCAVRHLPFQILTRQEMDITDPASVAAAVEEYEPWAIVNTAGYVRVDDAENDQERCFRENALGPEVLAQSCASYGIRFLTFSSDLVFCGSKGSPYFERDHTAPCNTYGLSKAEGERRVLAALPSALVVRTSAFFGPWDEYNFVAIALKVLGEGKQFVAAGDAVISPTYVPDLVHVALDLFIDGEYGLWHLSNEDELTWADFARRAARFMEVDERNIEGRPTQDLKMAAPRPLYSAMLSERASVMPTLDDALARYRQERTEHLETLNAE